MIGRGFLSRGFPTAAAVLFFYLAEVLWGITSAPPLPVGPVAYTLAAAAMVCVSYLFFLLNEALSDRRSEATPLFFALLAMAVLAGKLWLAAGTRSITLPLLVVLIPPLGVLLPRFVLDRAPHRGTGWTVVFLVTVGVSTDSLKTLWIQTTRGNVHRPMLAAGLALFLTACLWLFLTAWDTLEELLHEHRNRLAGILLLGISTVGVLLAATGTHSSERTPRNQFNLSTKPETKIPGRTSREGLPNIILVSIDTLRWDMVPPHTEVLDLPNLRRLRRDSVNFNHTFSTSGWTLPAHASLFTGLLPVEHGAQLTRLTIREDAPYFPRILRRLGYRTAAFTDGGYVDRSFGFDRGFNIYWQHGEPDPFRPYRGFVPGSLEPVLLFLNRFEYGTPIEIRYQRKHTKGKPGKRFFEPNLQLARNWIRARGLSPDPFFLFLHTYEVHDHRLNRNWKRNQLEQRAPDLARTPDRSDTFEPAPVSERSWSRFVEPHGLVESDTVAERFEQRWSEMPKAARDHLRSHLGGLNKQRRRSIKQKITSFSSDAWRNFLSLSPEDRRTQITRALRMIHRAGIIRRHRRIRKRLYGYGIEHTDESLGDFLRWLERRGLYEDTLIVFLSDHGEGFKLISRGINHGYGSIEDVLTRVSFWIKLPGNEHAGRTVPSLISLTDVFPMLLEKEGIPVPCEDYFSCENRSFRRVNPFPIPRRNHVRYSVARNVSSNDERPREKRDVKLGVRGDRFKLVSPPHADTMSFWKVHPDRLLQKKLLPGEVPRDVRRRLRRSMRQYRLIHDRAPNPFLEPRGGDLDPDLRNQLEALGYL